MIHLVLCSTLILGIFVLEAHSYQGPRVPTQTKIIVNIGGNIRTITNSTSCDPQKWGKNQVNACQCCLAKQKLQKVDSQHALDYCLYEKKYCSQSIVDELKKENKLTDENDQTLADKVFQKVNLLPSVIYVTSSEGMTDTEALKLLELVEKKGYLGKVSPLFSSGCYKVEGRNKKGVTAGNTLQLFTVSYNENCKSKSQAAPPKLSYILKEMKKGFEESKNLEKVRENIPNNTQEIPNLALPVANWIYIDQNNKKHYMSLLPMAEGISLRDRLKQYGEAPVAKRSALRPSILVGFERFGEAMAALHIKYMEPKGAIFGKTITHSDAHLENVFTTNKGDITLIDNETMAKSLANRQHPERDLMRFYAFTTLDNPKLRRPTGIEDEEWHNLTLEPFLKGYIAAYLKEAGGAARKGELIKELKKIFLEQNMLSFYFKFNHLISPFIYKKYKGYIRNIFLRICEETPKVPCN